MLRHRRLTRLVMVFCIISVAIRVQAVSPEPGLGWRGPGLVHTTPDDDPLTRIIPELKSLPAPPWLREGVRAYYRAASATVPNPFASSKSNARPEIVSCDKIGTATPALIRTDVIALATRFSATSSTVFVGDPMIPWEDASATGYSGAGDFWANPVVFRDLLKKPRSPLSIEEVQYDTPTKTYEAVRLDYSAGEGGNHYTWIMEASTGLLLHQSVWVPLSDRRLAHLSVVEFVSVRTVSSPWAGGSVPSWVKPGAKMTYDGTIRTWLPSTGPNIPIPAALEVEFTAVGPNWSEACVKRLFSGQPADASMTVHSGTGMIAGGFWVPRAQLSKLKNGDVLDSYDPIVQSRVEVSYAGTTRDGQQLVAIFEWGTKYKRVWIYRSTDGMLVYWLEEKMVDPGKGMVQQAEWQLRGY